MSGGDELKRAYARVLRSQIRVIAVVVLCLSLLSWWKQGLATAAIGGSCLFVFLVAIQLVANYFARRRNTRA